MKNHLKNAKLLGILLTVFWFTVGAYAFSGPPVGCTPLSCSNGPLAELKEENIKNGVTIAGVTGTLDEIDSTPDNFDYTDQSDVSLTTLIESNIQQITGVNHPAEINISGVWSPAYRICNNSDCSSVKTDWRAWKGYVKNGEYLQIRQTSNSSSSTRNDANVSIWSGSDVWSVTTALNTEPCAGMTYQISGGYNYWWPNAELHTAVTNVPIGTKICMKLDWGNQWSWYGIEFTRSNEMISYDSRNIGARRFYVVWNALREAHDCSNNWCFAKLYWNNTSGHNNLYAGFGLYDWDTMVWHSGCGSGPAIDSAGNITAGNCNFGKIDFYW